MPSVTLPSPTISKGVYLLGQLSITNQDKFAERYAVIDRATFYTLRLGDFPPSGVVKLLLPPTQATNGVIVVIMDDDKNFNAEIVDGVTCELVDANRVNL